MQSDFKVLGSDDELLLKYEAELAEGISEQKSRHRRLVQAMIAQGIKDFQSGHLKVESVDDLKTLIQLDIDLMKDDF